MKRKEILNRYAAEDNKGVILADLIEKDKKFITRRIQELKNKLEDATEALQTRLRQEHPIDDSVIVSLYGEIVECENTVALYEAFQEDYL